MRLKRLNLQGFKTFAPKTDLVFGEGLTAIVGPNGSGKSNIADAIKWVLGEQSLSNLRAKRTEDLVFAGSSNRAPLGMAEVSITIDNGDRLLPIEFAEVTLARRAYRSGENEYYINKSRVRLRDVLDVASKLGQAYTVVGQGLVDAALSLRPEERRELFEEAAAIRGYYVQREDALKRLAKTEENVARVNDLASELEPQVRRMERQAKQAEEYQKLNTELRGLLRTWYLNRAMLSMAALKEAEEIETRALATVEASRSALEAKSAELGEVRTRVWTLIESVSALQEARAQVQSKLAAQSQTQAVLSERLSSARSRRDSLQHEQDALLATHAGMSARLQELDADAAGYEEESATLEEEGREVATRLRVWDTRIWETQTQQKREAARLESQSRRGKDLAGRMSDAERQRAEQEKMKGETEAALATLRNDLSAEASILDERRVALAAAQDSVKAADEARTAAQADLVAARSAQQTAEVQRRDLLREADGVASQLAALAGEQQAGLYGGVRAVVSAAREGKLDGFVGTVAELLRVPPDLETAIEAALGGRLQDVVVSEWGHAERAIALLKQTGAGRATFLPLDTLRAAPAPTPPRGPGILGSARDLVDYDASLNTLAESLLGRLLIVEDLPAARRTVANLPAGAPWTLATLGGEVVRPGGSVTGGSNTRADDNKAKGRTILARERKRRELQAAQENLRVQTVGADRLLNEAAAVVRQRENDLAMASQGADEARKQQVAAQVAVMEQQGVVDRLEQEIAWRTTRLNDARKSIERTLEFESKAKSEQETIEAGLVPLRQQLSALDAELKRLMAERAQVAQAASERQTRIAVLAETLRNLRGRQEEMRKEAARHESRHAELLERIERAARDEQALAAQLEGHGTQVGDLAGRLHDIEARIGPSEDEVRLFEGEVGRIEAEQSGLQAALIQAETTYSHAAVERQRCSGVLDSLRVEVMEELGVDIAPGEARHGEDWGALKVLWPEDNHETATITQQEGSSGNGHTTLPVGGTDMAQLERRIYALKSKLSRIGPVNPLALEEYTTLADRHTYLQSQLGDLMSAAESLRRIIRELDTAMREQFTATFVLVNDAFEHFFTTLFGGGSARLELTNPQDVSNSGVEILAQAPGKRMQPLAALSGGERALTSAALLFALLKVRPVPFCVLDEVDAALDESNVTRFRSALQELGRQTQFVVITHNRGTIEAADTLYGVSMAGDGTSQMLSLKVAV
ncbi:MAG TPA: chromosome segregation protein SMC [Chloroflexia bacterium]|jgi:chromosome segregation protein